jgi:hypothetical protein
VEEAGREEGHRLRAQVVLEQALIRPQLAGEPAEEALGQRMEPEIVGRRQILEQAHEEAEHGSRHRALIAGEEIGEGKEEVRLDAEGVEA